MKKSIIALVALLALSVGGWWFYVNKIKVSDHVCVYSEQKKLTCGNSWTVSSRGKAYNLIANKPFSFPEEEKGLIGLINPNNTKEVFLIYLEVGKRFEINEETSRRAVGSGMMNGFGGSSDSTSTLVSPQELEKPTMNEQPIPLSQAATTGNNNGLATITITVKDKQEKLLKGIVCDLETNSKTENKMETISTKTSSAVGECSFQALDPTDSYLVRVYWTKDKSRSANISLGHINPGETATGIAIKPF